MTRLKRLVFEILTDPPEGLGLCVLALPIGIIGAGFVHQTTQKPLVDTTTPSEKSSNMCPHCGLAIQIDLH